MNTRFTSYIEGFREWLQIIGYTHSSTVSLPGVIRRYLEFMHKEGIKDMERITTKHTLKWYRREKQRKSGHTGELLKNSTLNGNIRCLKLFSRYMEETGRGTLTIDLAYEPKDSYERDIFTKDEIRALYKATGENIKGIRDRAILSVYYGCGLRSREGRFLQVKDILTDRKLLYVRQGKQHRERYVPFVKSQMDDFLLYLKECRPQLVRPDQETPSQTETWFLLNNNGKQVSACFLLERIKTLAAEAGIDKKTGLHLLRHSIATHLMQSGMKLEAISQFLGHKNLHSTQRYTHVAYRHEGL